MTDLFGLPTIQELSLKRAELFKEIADIDAMMIQIAGDPAKQILDFLNKKTGKNYRPVQSNLSGIRARLNEGFSADQIRQVIALKAREWRGTEFSKFLNPVTLFRASNFANYSGNLK